MILRVAFAIAILISAALNTYAQDGYFRTAMIKKGSDFSFPIFSSKQKRATAKINQLLQLSELYYLARPPYTRRIFSQAEANDGSIYGGKTSIGARVYSNNARILSVGFAEASSGATMHYWVKYHNFNSGNGDRLTLRDLFTLDGYKEFFKTALRLRSAKYRVEVKKKIEPQYQENYLEALGCFETDDLTDFYVTSKGIVIDGDSCLIKNAKFDGLDMEVAVHIRNFTKHLNAYGRAIFGLSSTDVSHFRSKELPQLFHGAVDGKYKFVMVLSPNWGDEYWGMYAYVKYGEGIALRGMMKDGELTLTEYTLSPTAVDGPLGEIRRAQQQGSIFGHLVNGTLNGFWADKEKKQQLPILASIQ